MSVGVPTYGAGRIGGCTALTLFRDDAGAIDAVLVSDARAPVDVPGPSDVVRDSVIFAHDRLETAGYAVEVLGWVDDAGAIRAVDLLTGRA